MTALMLAAAMTAQDPWTDLRQTLDSLEKEHLVGAVYVVQENEPKFFHGVGEVNPKTGARFTPQTAIEIGSIVKSFVKAEICRLAADGTISLDDPISNHFEDVPADKRQIKIKHLVDFTAGFPDMFGGDYQPMGRDELMSKMLTSPLAFEAGTDDRYSNSSYSMLATIIEKVTGKSIEEQIAVSQFAPLGLKKTGYVLPRWQSQELPYGYTRAGEPWGTPLDKYWAEDGPSWNLRGNGGMLSTFEELAKWGQAVHGGSLLSKKAYALYEPELAEDPAGKVAADAGGNGIFNCVLVSFPGEEVTLVAFSADGRLVIEDHLQDIFSKAMKALRA